MSLDTTVGGAYADSFLTAEEAYDYLINYALDGSEELAVWEAMSDGQHEIRLRIAAQLMANLPLRGNKVYEYQALCFPRSCQLDVEEIPSAVKEAQSLLAFMTVAQNIEEQSNPQSGGSELLDNALVKSIEIMGVMRVGLQNTFDSVSSQSSITGKPLLYRMMRAYGLPIWALLKPYLTQFKGGSLQALPRPTASGTWPEYGYGAYPYDGYEVQSLLPSPDYEG